MAALYFLSFAKYINGKETSKFNISLTDLLSLVSAQAPYIYHNAKKNGYF